MSTQIDDFKNEVLLGASVFPSTISDTNVGVGIDMIEADGRCIAIQTIGAVSGTTPSLTCKVQESSDNSVWTDVVNANFVAVTASNNVQVIVFDRTKRYLRHSRTIAGTSPSFALSALIGEQKKLV